MNCNLAESVWIADEDHGNIGLCISSERGCSWVCGLGFTAQLQNSVLALKYKKSSRLPSLNPKTLSLASCFRSLSLCFNLSFFSALSLWISCFSSLLFHRTFVIFEVRDKNRQAGCWPLQHFFVLVWYWYNFDFYLIWMSAIYSLVLMPTFIDVKLLMLVPSLLYTN